MRALRRAWCLPLVRRPRLVLLLLLLPPLLLFLFFPWPQPPPTPSRPRTDQALLLQHYRAREALFARDGKRVYFLHVHKAAGSTLCQAALDAGELANREANCNLAGPAKRALGAGSKAEQCAALRSAPYSFVANERGLPDQPVFAEGCLYVVLLREPRLRYASQYLHLRAAGEAFLAGTHPLWPAELRYMRVPPADGVPSFASVLSGGPQKRIPSGFRDSFQTRALAGASTHGLGDGEMNETIAARARAALSLFDWVGTVEAFSGERAMQDAVRLSSALGWGGEGGWANVSRRGSRSNSLSFLASLDSETRILLEKKVGFDAELYDHAETLAAAQRYAGTVTGRDAELPPSPSPPARESCHGESTAHNGGPFGNWSYGCRADAAALVAACAVLPKPASTRDGTMDSQIPELIKWLHSAAEAGVGRVYLHVEGGEGPDGTGGPQNGGLSEAMMKALAPFLEAGSLSLISGDHPPPRFGLRERGPALEASHSQYEGLLWSGYREVQGRCLTQALLEGACWLVHAFPGPRSRKLIRGRFTRPADGGMALPASHADDMCLRLWPGEVGGGAADTPSDFVPWMLNVGRAYAELREKGPHAVVPSPEGVWGRSRCTKCRGMLPELGLQDRFTPEVDPCIGYYTSSHAAKKGRTWCVQDWCAGAGTVPVALE